MLWDMVVRSLLCFVEMCWEVFDFRCFGRIFGWVERFVNWDKWKIIGIL